MACSGPEFKTIWLIFVLIPQLLPYNQGAMARSLMTFAYNQDIF